MLIAAFYAITADNTVLIIVYHKRMSEHGTAAFIHVSRITGMILTPVQAEVTVRAKLEHRRHCENCIDCSKRAEIATPGPSGKEHAENDRPNGNRDNDPSREYWAFISIPNDLHP